MIRVEVSKSGVRAAGTAVFGEKKHHLNRHRDNR